MNIRNSAIRPIALAMVMALSLSALPSMSKPTAKPAVKPQKTAAPVEAQTGKELQAIADNLSKSVALMDQMNQYVGKGSDDQSKTVVTCSIFLADRTGQRETVKISNSKHPVALKGGFDPKKQALQVEALALSQVLPILMQNEATKLLARIGDPSQAVVTIQLQVDRQSKGKTKSYLCIGQAEFSGQAQIKSIGILADKDHVFADDVELKAEPENKTEAAPQGPTMESPKFDTSNGPTTDI